MENRHRLKVLLCPHTSSGLTGHGSGPYPCPSSVLYLDLKFYASCDRTSMHAAYFLEVDELKKPAIVFLLSWTNNIGGQRFG